MNNITDFLKEIAEFTEFATKRALELLKAKGCKIRVSLDKIEFELDEVYFTFIEITNHDCPDYENITLKISELEMNETFWNDYINKITNKTLTDEDNKLKLEEKRKLAIKEKDYLRLKKELGY